MFGAMQKIRVHKSVQIAILEFYGKQEIKTLAGLVYFADNPQPMVNIPHVVIGHLKNKQRFDIFAGRAAFKKR
jgi:hypothetical protein